MASRNYVKESESWLRPGAELQTVMWLALLGIPLFLLFLVYSKQLHTTGGPEGHIPGVQHPEGGLHQPH